MDFNVISGTVLICSFEELPELCRSGKIFTAHWSVHGTARKTLVKGGVGMLSVHKINYEDVLNDFSLPWR